MHDWADQLWRFGGCGHRWAGGLPDDLV